MIGEDIPKPRAVLCVSAPWYVPATHVTAMRATRTIHDFGGFPRELFEVEYPAAGDPELARRVQGLLAPIPAGLDQQWGLAGEADDVGSSTHGSAGMRCCRSPRRTTTRRSCIGTKRGNGHGLRSKGWAGGL